MGPCYDRIRPISHNIAVSRSLITLLTLAMPSIMLIQSEEESVLLELKMELEEWSNLHGLVAQGVSKKIVKMGMLYFIQYIESSHPHNFF